MTTPQDNVTPQDPATREPGLDTGGRIAEDGDLGTINISPINPPTMKTLVYSPEVQILIARGNKQYDVSNDIVAWSVRKVENGVSSLVFRLSNKAVPGDPKKLRYNQLFERMDRVILKLKRVEWIQVFCGYLDQVPHVQLYPGTVNFRASCTLKRLLHTWWDPALPRSRTIFNQAGTSFRELENGEEQLDKGLGSVLRRLLVEVGGWNPQHIHIQRFPMGFFLYMQEYLRQIGPSTEQAGQNFKELLLGEDTTAGPGRAASRAAGITTGNYAIPAPARMLEVIRAVDEMGLGPDTVDIAAAQGVGAAAEGGKDQRDQAGWKGIQEVGMNWGEAAIKSDAAVHCFMTIYAESNFVMYANAAVPSSLSYPYEALSTDGTSVGLYQQQNFGEWGSVGQRMNVKASTQMFLQHLQRLDWRNMDRAAACQAVQRSAYADGSNYARWENVAIESVRAIRTGTGTGMGTGGQTDATSLLSPTMGLGGATVGTIPGVLTGGPINTGNLPGIPTSNGTPTTTAAASLIGKPIYDTGGALSCAMSQVGKPYLWGAKGPEAFDCSGLTQFAYRSIGLEIGQGTEEQAARCQRIPWTNLVPGDIIQPDPGHTGLYVGPGSWIAAPQGGDFVRVQPIYFDLASASCYRVPGAEFGGTLPAPFDIARAVSASNAVAGTVTTGLNGTTSTGTTEPIARNLFTYQFQAGQFANDIANSFGGSYADREKAFINDEPLIQTVISMAQAGLRNFQSAPNGDFIAYYPDYFGIDGKDPVWTLEDIEMKDVQIDLNDDALATHVYVAGSALPTAGTGGGVLGWLQSQGVATVENEFLFRMMTAAAPKAPGERLMSGSSIMNKFGVRPLVKSMSSVRRGAMEFLLAVQTFMTKWAEQYSTQIETTFMPEVLPGMRVELKNHNLQVYVSEVTHSGDFESGFTTSMTIMAPSTPALTRVLTNMFSATAEDIAAWQEVTTNPAEVAT